MRRGGGVSMPPGLSESLVCAGRALGMGDQVEALADVTAFESTLTGCQEPPAEIVVIIDAGRAPF